MASPPDFVLEVASVSTARNDYTQKGQDYAAFGIPEYWRFDPTGGRRYDAPWLATGWLKTATSRLTSFAPTRRWGHSAVLNLDVCWEYGKLRWWDPAAGRYLETHEQEAEGRIAAETRADTAEARIRELEAELRRRQNRNRKIRNRRHG